MYRPKYFDVDDPSVLHAFMRENSFIALITNGDDGIVATHIPVLIETTADGRAVLHGHVAKANLHWQLFDGNRESMALFWGPHAYISPRWYDSDKLVPTWNYVTAHAYGRPRIVGDPDRVYALLAQLTETNESGTPAPWRVEDKPDDFIRKQFPGIVAFEMPIDRLEGKRKMNQNKQPADIQGSIEGLRTTGRDEDAEVADIMEAVNKDKLNG